MRHRLGVLAALCAALAGLSAIKSPEVESAYGAPLVTGVSYMSDLRSAAFENIVATGSTMVQSPLVWSRIAPRHEPASWAPSNPADPHYDWRAPDAWVAGAIAQGLTPVLQVSGAPAWAQGCVSPIPTDTTVCRPEPTELESFARAAASRYSGEFGGLPRVRFWQGLNEPNLSLFFNPQFSNGDPVSPGIYRRLINVFYTAVKSIRRSNVVIAAGLAPIARPGSTLGPMRFARKLLCMRGRRDPQPTWGNCGGGVRFDVFDIHPYTTGGPTHEGKSDDVQLGDLGKLTELLAAADSAGRIHGRFRRTPVWITEFSWDSRPPDPGGVPIGILRRWTAEALFRAWRAGVSRFFWFSLRDFAREPHTPFSESLESGLFFRGHTLEADRPKPNLQAFRFPFVAYSRKDGFYFWGRTPTSRGGSVVLQVREYGRWSRAGVARTGRHGIFDGKVAGSYGREKRGWVRAVYRQERSVPFSLKPIKDFYQPPFGKAVG